VIIENRAIEASRLDFWGHFESDGCPSSHKEIFHDVLMPAFWGANFLERSRCGWTFGLAYSSVFYGKYEVTCYVQAG
jgi:hypothetical protein